jgi:hypothetical protein
MKAPSFFRRVADTWLPVAVDNHPNPCFVLPRKTPPERHRRRGRGLCLARAPVKVMTSPNLER